MLVVGAAMAIFPAVRSGSSASFRAPRALVRFAHNTGPVGQRLARPGRAMVRHADILAARPLHPRNLTRLQPGGGSHMGHEPPLASQKRLGFSSGTEFRGGVIAELSKAGNACQHGCGQGHEPDGFR
jgi:hypothetical protein